MDLKKIRVRLKVCCCEVEGQCCCTSRKLTIGLLSVFPHTHTHKNAPLITNAEGTFLYSKAFQERTTEGILDLFMQAREKFEIALRSNPTDKTTLKLAAITRFSYSSNKSGVRQTVT